jgi:hypothetical protein
MSARSTWDNADGLRVLFNARPTENSIAGESAGRTGSSKKVEMIFRGEDLAATAATADARAVVIPAGAFILSATLYVSELFVGATATLDVGTQDLTGVAIDADGLVAAAAVASLVAGAKIVGAGAQIGTKLASAARLDASYNTAAFTAGAARLVVEYLEPAVQTT